MTAGLTLGDADTPLTTRAAELLATGPADAQALISYVCQLPGAPLNIAEHMAAALFAGHQRFVRDRDGRWRLREAPPSRVTRSISSRTSWSTSRRPERVPSGEIA